MAITYLPSDGATGGDVVCGSVYWPRDWLGRTSPKQPILRRVGRETSTQSIDVVCGVVIPAGRPASAAPGARSLRV